jgi:hypothetical protein
MALLAFAAVAAAAREQCEPPTFYKSLPRDREFYYGVARATDTDQARDQAIRNLAKQATGEVEGWSQEAIDHLAGPGQDRWEVASAVGRLLPSSSLLAGWEQDDFARCQGESYVLVRIEKARVERFVQGSSKFQGDLAGMLSRLKKVEVRVDDLTTRLERLEKMLSRCRSGAPETQALANSVVAARSALNAGRPRADVERKLIAAEDAYAKLEARMRAYQKKHDAFAHDRLLTLRREKAPEIKRRRDDIAAGRLPYPNAANLLGIYQEMGDYESERDFCREVLQGRVKLESNEDQIAAAVLAADLSLKDDQALLADGETFLRKYPASRYHEMVRTSMESAIVRARSGAAEPDPCPAP